MAESSRHSIVQVLYEDNHLICVYKPSRVPIQSDRSGDVSLLELSKAYLKEKYKKRGNVYLGLVHRLDRPVSGVVVFAKTSKAAGRLSEVFRSREVRKTYRAMVEGSLDGEGRLTHFIGKYDDKNSVLVKEVPFSGAKEAVLEYGVVKKLKDRTLVEIELRTGRKHQIRAQFAKVGHPIVGDKKYGATRIFREGEIALVAVRLEFPHPVKKERILVELDLNEIGSE